MFYSIVISKMLSFDYRVPVIMASLHDIGRMNDRKDEQHGLRSAEYYRNILSGQRKYDRYKKYTDIIYYVIANHNTCQSSGIFEYDMYLNILKIADALDRFRLQRVEWWPNGRLMPFKFLNHFMERFKIFTCRTEIDLASSDRSFDDVLNTIEVNLNVLIKDE